MGISAVGSGAAATPVAKTTPKITPSSSEGSPQAASVKQDRAIISDKARELAAIKAGTTAQEEANESMAAKAREGTEA